MNDASENERVWLGPIVFAATLVAIVSFFMWLL